MRNERQDQRDATPTIQPPLRSPTGHDPPTASDLRHPPIGDSGYRVTPQALMPHAVVLEIALVAAPKTTPF
ncbi:MAG: hypothetical protein ACODAD_02010 [Planctomycetota bacterium]